MVGRVRSFNPIKYGFITIEGDMQFFFSRSSVIGAVRVGDEVDFWLGDGAKRGELVAVDVRVHEAWRVPVEAAEDRL